MKFLFRRNKNKHTKYLLTLFFGAILLFSSGIFTPNAFADTVISTVNVGIAPLGIGVNSQSDMIYVANYNSGTVSVIDDSTNKVVNTISVGSNPSSIAVNPITDKIYVSDASGIQIIDGSSNRVVYTIGVGISSLATNPNTNMIYASGGNKLFVINGTTNTVVTQILVPGRGGGIGVNPSTNKIYEYSLGYSDGPTGYFIAVDGTTNTILQSMKVGDSGGGVAVNSNTNRIYVNDNLSMYIIDGPTNTQIATVKFTQPVSPSGIAVNLNTNKIYVGDDYTNSVFVMDGTTNTILQTLKVDSTPSGITTNPNTNKVYVTNYGSNSVSVIDSSPNTSATSILTVNSQDSFGNVLSGYYTELYASNGTQIDTGYTPYNFTLSNEQNYTVHVEDYGKYVFGHWLDTDSTDANRTVSASSYNSITAVYKTVSQPPTGLVATAVSSSQINLSWNTPTNDGGSQIIGYEIKRSSDGSTWSVLIKNTGDNGTTYSDSGLSPDSTYYYRVFAINDVGVSTRSNIASTTTPLFNMEGTNVGPISKALP